MGDDSKNNTGAGLVSSGTGKSVNADAVLAGDFAYGALGQGTAGGMGNAALISTTSILPNTRRTKVSKDAMVAADKDYTTKMNLVSGFWSIKDTSSPAYEAAKKAAMTSQYNWELARNNLEEVASLDRGVQRTGIEAPEITLPQDLSVIEAPLVEDEEVVVTANPKGDERIRFRPLPGNRDEILGTDAESVLYMLRETNGVFFPYTPSIDTSSRAEYASMAPTHANTSYMAYTHTPAVQINISGKFSAQNLAEARYTLAAMHFFRAVTKMHFGQLDTEDGTAGLPPPVLLLSGYGEFMFNDLQVVITEFKMDLPDDVNYIEVTMPNGALAWVPSLTTFTVSCTVQHTAAQQRDNFSFKEFAAGSLPTSGWI